MMIDATFWVAVSFFIFVGILIYFKVPQKIESVLNDSIKKISSQILEAEKLKEEAKNILSEHEKRISNSKIEIKKMIAIANDRAEQDVIKANSNFHNLMENRKKAVDQRIKQMKDQASRDIKNAAVKITMKSVTRLLKNSIDKNKLDKLYLSSLEETKIALSKKSS